MNKKIIIAVSVIVVFIFLVLLLLLMMDNSTEKKVVNFSMADIAKNDVEELPTYVNETESEEPIPEEDENEDVYEFEEDISFAYDEYNRQIPIPPTFEYVEGGYDDGVVIQDEDGNQFVWIPVENIDGYKRRVFTEEELNKTDEEILSSMGLKERSEYNPSFSESVEKYKGFYVARYEAALENRDGGNFLVSKGELMPLTLISWNNAKEYAENMYIKNNKFESDLMNSYAWDTICEWMMESGIDITDSVEYGNYQNSTSGMLRAVETGSNDRWKKKNIYDMAGNVWEYTTEENGVHELTHIARGGGYLNEGENYSILSRGFTEDGPNDAIGFRVVLYLK